MGDGCSHCDGVDRRTFLAVLAAGVLGALQACTPSRRRTPAAAPVRAQPVAAQTPAAPEPLPPIPPPHPGRPVVVTEAPKDAETLALTIDDGLCADCVAAYVDFAARTGIQLTFSPNGEYRANWEPHATRLRPLIAAGQVQVANHTWTHKRLPGRRVADIEADIQHNEDWIQSTFGITARPWFRPPYGLHNRHTDEVAAGIGYTRIVMWNGSLGDAVSLTPDQLMHQADRYLKPGTIVLGHANHPTVTQMFDQLTELLASRRVVPVTLDSMFGTSRATG
jgi:peptidoglycan/xylan/chitin deacetylase (PgdA/CDA1 family)